MDGWTSIIIVLQGLTALGVVGGAVSIGRVIGTTRTELTTLHEKLGSIEGIDVLVAETRTELKSMGKQNERVADLLTEQNGRLRLTERQIAGIQARCDAYHLVGAHKEHVSA